MENKHKQKWKKELYVVIFGVDTKWGKLFDILLLVAIVLSVLAVMLESVPSINDSYHVPLYVIEWVFTILFTLEYIARMIVAQKPLKYARSLFGIVDLLSIIPTYLSLFITGAQMLLV